MSLNDYMTNLKQTVMNEDIDLTKILKDCPKGTVLWSDDYGKVEFLCIDASFSHPIRTIRTDGNSSSYTKEGWCDVDFPASCLLWPSKDQRDWSKFTAPWYKKKPEHKFLVGQYVTDGYMSGQITSIEDNYNCYKILDVMGDINTFIPFALQDNYHLWTINDAKEGDVLATSAGAFIYNGNNGGGSCPGSYCGINTLGSFKMGVEHHWTGKKVYPATKKQRDLLFQKIKEAGYKWNDETKTLEKLVKDKFDPKTLKPFDKVLVRDSHNAVWSCKWFSHIMDLSKFYKYATTGCLYRYCIPFNDETEHLVGTTDEAPEFYKYWED